MFDQNNKQNGNALKIVKNDNYYGITDYNVIKIIIKKYQIFIQ